MTDLDAPVMSMSRPFTFIWTVMGLDERLDRVNIEYDESVGTARTADCSDLARRVKSGSYLPQAILVLLQVHFTTLHSFLQGHCNPLQTVSCFSCVMVLDALAFLGLEHMLSK
jgi:hypothetical protein